MPDDETVSGPRWVRLTSAAMVDDGRAVPVWAEGRELVVWRRTDGSLCVMEGTCPHRGASLAGGDVSDDSVECPLHGWIFDADGRNVGRADGRPLVDATIPCYPAREVDGDVMVDLPSRRLSDARSPHRP